jgi:hypothetical protein
VPDPVADPAAGALPGQAGGPVPRLAGRDSELQLLLTHWRRARDGVGGAVLVTGDGGTGKTRLAEHLLDTARRDGARIAGCAPGALGGAPGELWSELLAETVTDAAAHGDPLPTNPTWAAALARSLPAVAVDLPSAPAARTRPRSADGTRRAGAPPPLLAASERIRLFEAVVGLVRFLAARGPLVLLLEDLHQADPTSLDLLGYLGRRLGRLPVLLVLTRRRLPPRPRVDGVLAGLRARGCLRLDLDLTPLDASAVRRLARSVAPLSERQLTRIVAVADGNPLLVLAVAAALARGGDPADGLRAATRTALSRLSAPARRFVELAAVAGRDLRWSEVVSLPLLADPGRAATEAVGCGLLRARAGAVGFRHEVLRLAVCQDLAAPDRRRLHDALTGHPHRRPDLTISTGAARARLVTASRWDSAVDFADRHVEPDGLRRLVVYAQCGWAARLRRDGRFGAARAALGSAGDTADRLGDPALVGLVRQERALVALASGDLTAAADELRLALPASASRLHHAEALILTGHPEEAALELRALALEPARELPLPRMSFGLH